MRMAVGGGQATLSQKLILSLLFFYFQTVSRTKCLCMLTTLRLSSSMLEMHLGIKLHWPSSDNLSKMHRGWWRLDFVCNLICFLYIGLCSTTLFICQELISVQHSRLIDLGHLPRSLFRGIRRALSEPGRYRKTQLGKRKK